MGGSWINGIEVLGDYLLKNGGPSLAWLVLCFVSLKKEGVLFSGLLALRRRGVQRPGYLKAGLAADVQTS